MIELYQVACQGMRVEVHKHNFVRENLYQLGLWDSRRIRIYIYIYNLETCIVIAEKAVGCSDNLRIYCWKILGYFLSYSLFAEISNFIKLMGIEVHT